MFLKLPFAISFSVFIFYFLQSNTRYFVNHLERFTCHYIYIYIYAHLFNKKTFTEVFLLNKCIYTYTHLFNKKTFTVELNGAINIE